MCVQEHGRVGGGREVALPKAKPVAAIGGRERPALEEAVKEVPTFGGMEMQASVAARMEAVRGALEEAGSKSLASRALSVVTGGRLGGGKEMVVPVGTKNEPVADHAKPAVDMGKAKAQAIVAEVIQPKALKASSATPIEVQAATVGRAEAVVSQAAAVGMLREAVAKAPVAPAAPKSKERAPASLDRRAAVLKLITGSRAENDRLKGQGRTYFAWREQFIRSLAEVFDIRDINWAMYAKPSEKDYQTEIHRQLKDEIYKLLGSREAGPLTPGFMKN